MITDEPSAPHVATQLSLCVGSARPPACASRQDARRPFRGHLHRMWIDGTEWRGEIVRFFASVRRATALSTLIQQRRLTPSCGGHAPTAERTVGRARVVVESLTPRPGIREQNRTSADIRVRKFSANKGSGAPHRITSPAPASSVAATSRPSALLDSPNLFSNYLAVQCGLPGKWAAGKIFLRLIWAPVGWLRTPKWRRSCI
jgi:hypothetical protein